MVEAVIHIFYKMFEWRVAVTRKSSNHTVRVVTQRCQNSAERDHCQKGQINKYISSKITIIPAKMEVSQAG